jgi:hypothetical protein
MAFPRSGAGSMPVLSEDALDRRTAEVQPSFCKAPRSLVQPHEGFSRATVSSWATLSSSERGRPDPRRARLPSYFAATRSRYQRKIVSGVASEAISASSLRPSGLALLDEQAALGIVESQPLGAEAGAKHAVFGAQVLDGFTLATAQPTGHHQNQKLKGRRNRHGRTR